MLREFSLVLVLSASSALAVVIDPDDFSPILPLPLHQTNGSEVLLVTSALKLTLSGSHSQSSGVLAAAVARYHGIMFAWGSGLSEPAGLTQLTEVRIEVRNGTDSAASLVLGVDESYNISVPADGTAASLVATTVWGALRGLETLSQLVEWRGEFGSYHLRYAPWEIVDRPRFAHRGVMIDTARHFLPLKTIFRQIDAAAFCKLNTIHIHFVDADSFATESIAFPELSKLGAYASGGPAPRPAYAPAAIYSVADQEAIVDYGRHRGIRIVAEFDLPGHAQVWALALPKLFATCPGGGSADGDWKHTKQLDMAAPGVDDFLDKFIGEMAGRFPAGTIHLGGDEINYNCINASADALAWLAARPNSTNTDLYVDFERRAHAIAAKHSTSLTTWNDVFVASNATGVPMPKTAIVHSWTILPGPVVKAGYRVLTSYYINGGFSNGGAAKTWEDLYNGDPMPLNLTASEEQLYIGAESVMWGEVTDQFNIDSKIWFRTSAFAERFWSANATIAERVKPFPADYTSPDINARLVKHRCRLVQRGIAAQAYHSILLPERGRWTQCELFLPTERASIYV